MAFVITQGCCSDASCTTVCPVDCIHPTPDEPQFARAEMLYIDPETCIDCAACVDVCPVDAISADHELVEGNERYAAINANYFQAHPEPKVIRAPRRAPPLPTDAETLRVAIVGSGPAGCYAAEELLSRRGVQVSMFERLPVPWGLVRAGVAPDHQKTKAIADLFGSTTRRPGFAFYLNVEIGTHLSHEELMLHHHAVIYAHGATTDRRLNIPGEDLPGCAAAAEFVKWYNSHPDFADKSFDLGGERAVIVGNGNVALDVARILASDPAELDTTDIAPYALEALKKSNIREIFVLGRRGPADAAYASAELLELSRIPGVDVVVDAAADSFDPPHPGVGLQNAFKLTLARELMDTPLDPAAKKIILRFGVSPVEVVGDSRVEGVRVVHNEVTLDADGVPLWRPTDRQEVIQAGLVLRSVGFRGVALAGVPFDEVLGLTPNDGGRVLKAADAEQIPGVYATGWIKRGPSGVIGTNKHCARETVVRLLEDFAAGRLTPPTCAEASMTTLLLNRQPEAVDVNGWQELDAVERRRGAAAAKPRCKVVDVEEMLTIALAPKRTTQPPSSGS
jgi:ferredoxin--NADP+ reductase